MLKTILTAVLIGLILLTQSQAAERPNMAFILAADLGFGNARSKNTELVQTLTSTFEAHAQQTDEGVEYWLARDIQHLLGYAKWENFLGCGRSNSERVWKEWKPGHRSMAARGHPGRNGDEPAEPVLKARRFPSQAAAAARIAARREHVPPFHTRSKAERCRENRRSLTQSPQGPQRKRGKGNSNRRLRPSLEEETRGFVRLCVLRVRLLLHGSG